MVESRESSAAAETGPVAVMESGESSAGAVVFLLFIPMFEERNRTACARKSKCISQKLYDAQCGGKKISSFSSFVPPNNNDPRSTVLRPSFHRTTLFFVIHQLSAIYLRFLLIELFR